MKKIFILALTLLILSVLPFCVYAAEVYVTDCNNAADDLLVTVKSDSDDFEGATINVGDSITYSLEGYGKGMHTANIDISNIDRAGENIPVTVTAHYSGGESEVIEKTVSIYKMAETITYYTKDTAWLLNIAKDWNDATGKTVAYNLDESGNETDDDGALLIKWSEPFSNSDTRVGFQVKEGSNAKEGIYYIEHDIYFIYGDEGKVAVPNTTIFSNYFRTTSLTSYPQNTDGSAWNDFSINTIIGRDSGGKLPDGTQLYTDTWYRIRIVIDKYTKDDDGNYTGGLRYYYAVADEDGNFGDFKLFANYPKVYMPALCNWRYEFKAPDGNFSFAFKNFKLVYAEPSVANYWYLDNTEYSDNSIKLTFSEDMGDISASTFKFVNKLNVDADGNIIYEEIPFSSVREGGVNEYILSLPKSLIYGKEYEIRLANNFTSSAGSVGFKEPATDEDGNGLWNLFTLQAPKYPINITHVEDVDGASVVRLNNPEIGGKHVAVCWYTEEGSLADFKVIYIAEGAADDTLTFERNNNKAYDSIKAYVFDFDANTESDESGKITIYDSK